MDMDEYGPDMMWVSQVERNVERRENGPWQYRHRRRRAGELLAVPKYFDVWAFWMMCICPFHFAEVLLVCGNVLLTLVHGFPDNFVSFSPCACPSIYGQSSWWTSVFPVAIFVKPPHRLSVWSALNSVARCCNTVGNLYLEQLVITWCWLLTFQVWKGWAKSHVVWSSVTKKTRLAIPRSNNSTSLPEHDVQQRKHTWHTDANQKKNE